MTSTVLYITAPGAEKPADAIELERVTTAAVDCVDSLSAARERVSTADCVVLAETAEGERADPETAGAICAETPLIYYAARTPTEGPASIGEIRGVDGYVRRIADVETSVTLLADELDWHRSGADRESADATAERGSRDRTPDVAPDRSKIARLHEMATRIVACREERRLFELAIETADAVLEFDASSIAVYEERDDGEWLVPVVASSAELIERAPDSIPLGEGALSDAFVRGESVRTDDLEAEREVENIYGGSRSVISVPIGDFGVFQAISARRSAYDEADLELAEILAAYVGETLRRVRAEGELVAERDRLSALFDNVPDPTVRYEFDGNRAIVRDVNAAFEREFGYDRATVVGENIDDYIVPPSLEAEARRLNETLLAGESLRTVSRRQTAEGLRDVLINVVPLEIGERSVEGFSIYTDITEQKRRERELTAQNEQLDEFASIVSHDLRNPLNVAQGYLELAEERGEAAHFEEVEAAHERMSVLIEKLLTLSRKGEVIADREAVAIHDVTARAWAAVDTTGAALEFGANGVLQADDERLVELLENLIRNSVEHGSANGRQNRGDDRRRAGETVTVRVGATETGLFVADDGPGIPECDRETVFESGYTTAADGTGYGLAIVDQIADAHGWAVRVTESERGGARFDIETEPARREEPTRVDAPPSSESG